MNRVRLKHVEDPDSVVEMLFRRLEDPMQAGWKSGYHWQVEAYQWGMEHPPVAIGWVLDLAPVRPAGVAPEDFEYKPDLECVRVFRDFDDPDLALAVIQAARLRWPELTVDAGSTAEGSKWIQSYQGQTADRWQVMP